jgi:predicted NBD/HSP70 family sugar kinase
MTRPSPAIPSGTPTRPGERADQSTVRHANLGTVLRHVAELGPCSRAAVAGGTGLTRGTVSSLVGELIELGLVRESAEPAGPRGIGRPGIAIELGGTVAAIGLEVNVDYLAVCLEDVRGEVRFERRRERDNRGTAPAPVLDRLAELAREALAAAADGGMRVVGLGAAVPGLVRASTGTLLRAPNLGWSDVAIADELDARLGLTSTIQVDNEANLAAVAEHWQGVAQDLASFVLLYGEIGVGGGIFVTDELFRGTHGFGGEIGHLTVDRDGPPCACGSRGCLETLVGLEALARAAGLEAGRTTSAQAIAEEIVRRAHSEDAATLAALAEAGATLGSAAASTVNLLDLEGVVLAGAYAVLAPWLGPSIADGLEEHLLAADWSTCVVRASTLGESAAARGAAAVSLRTVLAAPWVAAGREGSSRVTV